MVKVRTIYAWVGWLLMGGTVLGLSPVIAQPAPLVSVQSITVVGSTVFGSAIFESLIAPYRNQPVNREKLLELVDQINQLYVGNDYLTSEAVLVESSLATGKIQIQVFEGKVGAIEVQGHQRLNPTYIRSRVALATAAPLNPKRLETQLRLLREDPNLSDAAASLRAGDRPHESKVIVRVKEQKPWSGRVFLENTAPPSFGEILSGINLSRQNVTGWGDRFDLSYERSFLGGLNQWVLDYGIPLNPRDGILSLQAQWSQSRVVAGLFAPLDIRGNSSKYAISFRQPLVKTPQKEIALSLGISQQAGQTFTFAGPTPFGFGPDTQGVSRTTVLHFGQEYTHRDPSGAWQWQSQLNLGTGWLKATQNPDPLPDGQFVSWLGQVQRVQLLNPDQFLILQGNVQWSDRPLLASEQFVLGGLRSLRGFRQNLLNGDRGWRVSLEHRWILKRDEAGRSQVQLTPFFEMGQVSNHPHNPNRLIADRTFLASVGLGFLLNPTPKLDWGIQFGIPLTPTNLKGTSLQDEGMYLYGNYRF